MTNFRTAAELLAVDDPAWPAVATLIANAATPAQIVPASEASRLNAIEALQVTAKSFLGAVASHCGAILVDNGWLRLLGAGTSGLASIRDTTDLTAPADARYLIVALDVLGGRFAVNGGDLSADPGEICFWGSDTLDWFATGLGYSEFVRWALSDGLTDFYASLRWPDWQDEVSALSVDHGLSVYPFPFTREGQNLATTSRRPVPMSELLVTYNDLALQLAKHPEDSPFSVEVGE